MHLNVVEIGHSFCETMKQWDKKDATIANGMIERITVENCH